MGVMCVWGAWTLIGKWESEMRWRAPELGEVPGVRGLCAKPRPDG